MNRQLYYLYAVVRPRVDLVSRELPDEGIFPGAPIYALEYRDIQAIISTVPYEHFDVPALEAGLKDETWIHTRVVSHQHVLLSLLQGYTVLPCRFCTLYHSEERLHATLVEQYDSWVRSLQRLEGATEWGVKLFCDAQALTRWIEASSEVLRPLREAVAIASTGAGYFLQKRLTQAVQKHTSEVMNNLMEITHHTLIVYAREAAINPVQLPQEHGLQETMLFNGTYLVDDQRFAQFKSALARLEAEHREQGCQYMLTGPWPPYSFTS